MGAYLQELFKFNLYRRTQGKFVRQATFAAATVIVGLACWSLSNTFVASSRWLRTIMPLGLFLVGAWACFRLVQWPQFADFLISVEAEMAKVAWPKRTELINASIVVIVVIFLMAGFLFGFDLLLQGGQTLFQRFADWIAGSTELPVE